MKHSTPITLAVLVLLSIPAWSQDHSTVMRPPGDSNAIVLGESIKLHNGSGPWGHSTMYVGNPDLSQTTQTIQTQFFCGGGNGYSTLGLVQGGKGFILGADPSGNFAVDVVNWPGFPEAAAGSVIRHPVKFSILFDLIEQATPPAPATNTARVFVRDNGSGKTQLCVIFPTGAVQVLATQP